MARKCLTPAIKWGGNCQKHSRGEKTAHAPFSLLLIMGAGRGEKTAHAPFSVYVRADSEVDVKTFIVRGLLNNCIGSKGSKHRIVNGATLALPYAIALHGCIVGASCGNAATLT